MDKVIFNQQDLNVFKIDGLEARMEGLDTYVRPKFRALAQHFVPYLNELTGEHFVEHIAKHARRTVNPPKDTWVAFSTSSRGYKMLPHFQIGLWGSHVFVWFAMIYEAPAKANFGEKLLQNMDDVIEMIPDNYVWSVDHMDPKSYKHGDLTKEQLVTFATRLKQVKKAELLCGLNFSINELEAMTAEQFYAIIEDAYRTILPLYNLAK